MEMRNRRGIHGGLAACLALALSLLAAPSASASTTIGQLPSVTPPPSGTCNTSPFDLFVPTVTSGTSYIVPPGAAAITSWSTFATAGPNQQLEMKIFRHVTGIGDPNVYQVVGHDGPRPLSPNALNTFPTNLAVQSGDILGLNNENANPGAGNTACITNDGSGDTNLERSGNLADGGTGDFTLAVPGRLNVTAVIALKPTNVFTLGKTTRNKHKGTATVLVNVPGPGNLALTGKGVKAQRPGRDASASKVVAAAGPVKLRIKPKGKAKHKLNETGKVKVKINITFTPNGTSSGDVIGDPSTQTKKLKLVKTG
jgi:hypothetical protein